MRRKSFKYNTPDAGGWMHKADDLFLARFRGRPCAVCGATHGYYDNKTIRSMGHHLLNKGKHRLYRYDPRNIIVLCPKHHLGGEMSPHYEDGVANKRFYEWLKANHPDKDKFMDDHADEKFSHEWKYRIMYEKLGGEIHKDGPMKDWKPKGHDKKVAEAENG